ncbi:MAG: rRNA maturation RNase YbeY [Alphaproteobacteria bacterium]|nr:rRNA maturation RNase YbeY [Alphaproteobacteria bacterium]
MITLIFIGKVKLKKPILPYNNIKKFIKTCFKNKIEYINIIFCSKYYIKKINKKYLQHDYCTDIITFEYNTNPIESELFISTDIIQENANKFHVDLENEYLRIIFHGLLHLKGFKDRTELEKKIMKKQENILLKKFYEKNKKKMDTKT